MTDREERAAVSHVTSVTNDNNETCYAETSTTLYEGASCVSVWSQVMGAKVGDCVFGSYSFFPKNFFAALLEEKKPGRESCVGARRHHEPSLMGGVYGDKCIFRQCLFHFRGKPASSFVPALLSVGCTYHQGRTGSLADPRIIYMEVEKPFLPPFPNARTLPITYSRRRQPNV